VWVWGEIASWSPAGLWLVHNMGAQVNKHNKHTTSTISISTAAILNTNFEKNVAVFFYFLIKQKIIR